MSVATAREYLRVSLDRSGQERSPEEQHQDNQRAAEELGVRLGDPYREKGSASASRYATKERDDFRRLLGDLEAGQFGADILMLWESSRGSRKVGEWVTLLDHCEEKHVKIYVTTHSRMYDPANGRDRRSLLEDAVDSEYESSKTSARIRRSMAAQAREGRPHGEAPYGYVREFDPRTKRLVGQFPDPDRAMVIRRLFSELKRGAAFRAIARDFAGRGWVNRSGNPFTGAHLRTFAVNPAYAGLRVHRPTSESGPRGWRASRSVEPGMPIVKGTWEGLVSEEDFWSVQRILSDPRRKSSRDGRARHLLSMIAKCGVCQAPLAVSLQKHKAQDGSYVCRAASHVTMSKVQVDAYVLEIVWRYLAAPDTYEALTAGQDEAGQELVQVRGDLAHARHELETLRAKVGDGSLSVAAYAVAEPMMLQRIGDMEEAERRLCTPSRLHGLIGADGDVRQRWESMPITAQREAMALLLSPDLIGEVHLMPIPGRRDEIARSPQSRLRFKRADRLLTGGELPTES